MSKAAEIRVSAQAAYYTALKGRRTFSVQGKTYKYLFRRYNTTYANERAVEIPIAMEVVRAFPEERVLEVGNVLAHYYPHHHDVLDKYEQAPGVVNGDVVDFEPGKLYDLIISISTLEHVGWDEEPRDPPKFLRGVEHLATLLAPGGTLLVTLPIDYNAALDGFLKEGRVPFTSIAYLKRISDDNQWREASWEEVQQAKYIHARRNAIGMGVSPTATGLVVGAIQR
jgi:SAM-dependent methyltransferase